MSATARLSARQLIELVVDHGKFESWDRAPDRRGATSLYLQELHEAEARSGADEAIVTGSARVHGHPAALAVSEFSFMGGSLGQVAAKRLTVAIERATRLGLPLLAAPASGGTRMQEGTPAFIEMITISAAISRHKAAGLPYLVYLRHPTVGGVMASWGSRGHLTIAEPGALLGFIGPRVYEGLYGEQFPTGIQVAENLHAKGIIDGVVRPDQVRHVLARTLTILRAPQPALVPDPALNEPAIGEAGPDDPWMAISRSRSPERPGALQFLRHAAADVIPLTGTGEGESDRALLLALARFDDAPCFVLAQDRTRQVDEGPLGPRSLRVARRGITLAQELGLPLVSIIDTPGAALSPEAEESALAGEIARCLAGLVALEAPSMSILLGQGCGGGAVAMLPANRVLAAQNAWLAPLSPEGASLIVHRTPQRAADLARSQQIGAAELLKAGVVDRVVPRAPRRRSGARRVLPATWARGSS